MICRLVDYDRLVDHDSMVDYDSMVQYESVQGTQLCRLQVGAYHPFLQHQARLHHRRAIVAKKRRNLLISNLHFARKMKDLELILLQGKLHTEHPAWLGRNEFPQILMTFRW